jgi:UDP-N-acetylglucosamine 4,6-dehydratase
MQGGEIFVPKISSMKIVDLARAIAPDCSVEIIGVRPGEKLHEILITAEDGRHTVEYDGLYVILPQLSWWQTQNYKKAKELAEGFNYTSDNNGQWLKINELKKMVKEYSEPFEF